MKHSVKNNSQNLLHCGSAFSIINDESTLLKKASWAERDFWRKGGKSSTKPSQQKKDRQRIKLKSNLWLRPYTSIRGRNWSILTCSSAVHPRYTLRPLLFPSRTMTKYQIKLIMTQINCSVSVTMVVPCPAPTMTVLWVHCLGWDAPSSTGWPE